MKKLLTLTLALFLSLSIFGRPRELNPKEIDNAITDWVLDQLRDAGYTVLPEVIVQDTLNHKKQKFSSRYETKGGRGMRMPDWANDSTWSPGMKPPKEYDDLYYQPSKDGKQMRHQRQDVNAIVDTLVKENPEIIVNNYYNDDPFFYSHRIGMFYHGGFNYWHYNPFFYDPWDFDFGWGWNPYYGYNYPGFGYPYYNSFYFGWNNYWGWNFGWNYYRPYYGHNYWYGQHGNYYSHNNWNGGGSFQQRPEYGRRERPSNYTQGNSPSNRRFSDMQQQRNRIEAPQNKTLYGESRRSYTPSYDHPRMGTRPQYNNSKPNNMGRMYERRTEIGTESRTFSNQNMQRSTQSRTQISTERRTYQPNKNYSAPARSYSPAPNRSSEPQGCGRSFNFNSGSNGGGMDRRSSGSNFSGGGSSNSSAGSSGGGRSSGGSSSGRR